MKPNASGSKNMDRDWCIVPDMLCRSRKRRRTRCGHREDAADAWKTLTRVFGDAKLGPGLGHLALAYGKSFF